jgi:transcriptional regulator with GAF, ATPase, and Fis domain
MFETEFFGHARGAFTGARTERSGLFRTADGGTLFLDEVGEIPLDLQAKLLRVLENGVVRPVGADVELSVDTRVLCATNRNLLHEVRAGRFRKDLFYRLAVIEIPVPPLRDRREDIEALADLFYSRFLINSGTASRPLSRDLVRRLSSYSFPGNVRELKNLVERISILGRDPTDKELHLWMEPDGVDGLSINVYAESQKDGGTLNLESRERWAVQKALAESEGVQTAAARLLGISRQALERRIKRYDLSLQ